MTNRVKWLIIVAIIVLALLVVLYGFKLMFDFVLGPLPTVVMVFVIYGIGWAWTRSPSQAAEPPIDEDGKE